MDIEGAAVGCFFTVLFVVAVFVLAFVDFSTGAPLQQ